MWSCSRWTARVPKSVLILGDYGQVGRRHAAILDQRGTPTTVAGPDAGAARQLASSLDHASWCALDIADVAGLANAASEVDVVVSCSGVEDLAPARAVLEAGTDLVDISATPSYLSELGNWRISPETTTPESSTASGWRPG